MMIALAAASSIAFASHSAPTIPGEECKSEDALPQLSASLPRNPTSGKVVLLMAVDVDYPPYTSLPINVETQQGFDHVYGHGYDLIQNMTNHGSPACQSFEVRVMQAPWTDCWHAGKIGDGLKQGWYHACMTYTHPYGQRNRYVEFSDSWAVKNKDGGLLVRLNDNGEPVASDGKPLDGSNDLEGKTIVDVTNFAPTADTLTLPKTHNSCTNKPFKVTLANIKQGNTLYTDNDKATYEYEGETLKAKGSNDRALIALLNGKDGVDALWIYADQAHDYHCDEDVEQEAYECKLWRLFGKKFAYIHTGIEGWLKTGTTVTMAKLGSGIAEKYINPCLKDFMETEHFFAVCNKAYAQGNMLGSCNFKPLNAVLQAGGLPDFKERLNQKGLLDKHGDLVSQHFLSPEHTPWRFKPDEYGANVTCSTGFCPCPAS